jgi:hypothetical protein
MFRSIAAFGYCVFSSGLFGCSPGQQAARPPVAQNIAPAPAVPNLKGLLGLDAWGGKGTIVGSDLLIIKRVLHALMADPGITAERVDLDSQGGIVTLSGVVANPLVGRRVESQ